MHCSSSAEQVVRVHQACSSSSSSGGEQANGGAAVVQIVECVRYAAELAVVRGRGWARVQSVHCSSSAEQVVRV